MRFIRDLATLLRRGDFRRLFAVRLTSQFDDGVFQVALASYDSGVATGRDSVRLRATDVRARDAGTVTAGVSWRPTRWGRILGNASLERYGDARSAPEAGRTGSYVVLSTRFQIELP